MSKPQIQFTCSNCGAQFSKWTGRCLECGKWGSVMESKVSAIGGSAFGGESIEENNYAAIKTTTLNEIEGKNVVRTMTGIGELDRVLGGGLVPGSLILLGGEPGIGKSTLALQLATITTPPYSPSPPTGEAGCQKGDASDAVYPPLDKRGSGGSLNTFYFSGEESVEQIKLRADRLGIKSDTLRLANANNVDNIIATIKQNAVGVETGHAPSLQTITSPVETRLIASLQRLAIIDSIQTISTDEVEGEAGNIGQVRACTAKLMEFAKTSGTTIIITGQVTKDGNVAGPKTLEHLVDAVLYLEGDQYHQFRILRAAKNRFGSTDEVGVFAMEETGLKEVKNPSQAFLSGRPEQVPGSAVACLMEGTRPILLEIQALVSKTNFGYPQRRAAGFDLNRLQVLIAVLGKRAGLPLDSYDIFLNVVGGLEAREPAADLAVILAIASATQNKVLPKNLVAFGEVGLGGEVRAVAHVKKRLEEVQKLGFEYAVIPHSPDIPKIPNLKIAPLKNVQEIVEKVIQ